MSLIRKILILILLHAPMALAIVMPDEPKTSARIYLNSDYIAGPSLERMQRYGITALLRTPVPWGLSRFFSFNLLSNLDPDLEKRSGSVDIRQSFYSLNASIDFSFSYLFRYAVFTGGGVLWSATKWEVFDTKNSYNDFSRLANLGFMVDYAISQGWEIGWILQTQFRTPSKKMDWRQGFGLIYNF